MSNFRRPRQRWWDALLSSPTREVVLSSCTAILGAVIGAYLPLLRNQTDQDVTNGSIIILLVALASLIVISISIVYFAAFWMAVKALNSRTCNDLDVIKEQNKDEILEIKSKIFKAIEQQARLVPYATAYVELMDKFQEAFEDGEQHTVRILTYYTYDWENKIRRGDKERQNSEERKKLFKIFEQAIAHPKFNYSRIFQVPETVSKHDFETAIADDDLFYQEAKVLSDYAKRNQDRVALYRARSIYTESTLILIDSKHLYLDIGISSPTIEEVSLVFTIIDAKELRFKEFIKIHGTILTRAEIVDYLH